MWKKTFRIRAHKREDGQVFWRREGPVCVEEDLQDQGPEEGRWLGL